MNTSELIAKIEAKGLEELKWVDKPDADKVRAIRMEIAQACKLSYGTVKNLACGSQVIGRHSGELMRLFAQRKGVL